MTELICPNCKKYTGKFHDPSKSLVVTYCKHCKMKSGTLLEDCMVNGKPERYFVNGNGERVFIINKQ